LARARTIRSREDAARNRAPRRIQTSGTRARAARAHARLCGVRSAGADLERLLAGHRKTVPVSSFLFSVSVPNTQFSGPDFAPSQRLAVLTELMRIAVSSLASRFRARASS